MDLLLQRQYAAIQIETSLMRLRRKLKAKQQPPRESPTKCEEHKFASYLRSCPYCEEGK